jgi:hypothetical protein
MGALISSLVASFASAGALATAATHPPNRPTAAATRSCSAYEVSDCRRTGRRPLKRNGNPSPARSGSHRSGAALTRMRPCRTFRAKGTKFSATILRGEVRCRKARRVLRALLSGRGRLHGPRTGPMSEQTWTVDGWRCSYGAGGAACIHRGRTYKTARAWIAAQQTL